MLNARVGQANRDRAVRAQRKTTRRVGARQPIATPTSWDEGEAALAQDLAVLLNMGLIVAVDDGPAIRYAVSDGQEAHS